MITREEYDEACSLRSRGWSISAIARHLGRDRKTVRSHLGGERTAGVRSRTQDEFLPFAPYCRQRLADDRHLPATTLFDELVELGYPGGYSTFTRALRRYQLRPVCDRCRRLPLGHAPDTAQQGGEEVRFDWLTLPDAPPQWGGGSRAHVLVATLARTGRWRAVLAENEEFPQVVEAMDQALRRLGGTAGRWRFHRTPAACSPVTGRVTPAFTQVARYYHVAITCRPVHGERHGPADEAARRATRQWWPAVCGDTRIRTAQQHLDDLAARMDRPHPAVRGTQAAPEAVGGTGGLLNLPEAPFPARVRVIRTVTRGNLVPFRGNAYAVPPDLAGAAVEVHWRLDEPYLSISTTRGAVIARHVLAPRGAGLAVTGRGHSITLERPSRTGAGTPCPAGGHHPLTPAALAKADALRAQRPR
ncbi:Mu transposase domain-containing protein [Kitasatospora sp. NPDC050543]|uniref:Mu transposase domain-containing protein n=1 Tax=Kitasatospora sp. NPDC050543 TaxID=3364054 RepID=UPI0037BDA2AF